MTVSTDLREQAAVAVHTVAERLADVARVAELTEASARANVEAGGKPAPLWQPLSLSDGHPGVALLFAELAQHEAGARQRTYDHLAAASRVPGPPQRRGVYVGVGALALAAHCAGAGTGDFARLSGQLDAVIAERAGTLTAETAEVLRTNGFVGSWLRYDVISGATGLARLLLARHRHAPGDALSAVLDLLVALATAPGTEVDGVAVPAWWSTDRLTSLPEGSGHLNFGLAHGIAGPLAVLAIAHRAGVCVPGQEVAMERIAGLLLDARREDEFGPFWPYVAAVHGNGLSAPHGRGRDAWCYGAFGVSRALHLAGEALRRPQWTDVGLRAARAALAAVDRGLVTDLSLCHGWAGILRSTQVMAEDTGDEVLAAGVHHLAGRVLDGFDPASPFGFRFAAPNFPLTADRPGFLEGAAGIALALHSYATERPPVSEWDSALLLG